jgi:hypothetical protein
MLPKCLATVVMSLFLGITVNILFVAAKLVPDATFRL